MIKKRLLSFLGDMEGPPTFAEHRGLLDAQVLRFPDQATVPKDPNGVYGNGIKSALDSFSLLCGGIRHVEGILKPDGLGGSEPMVSFTSDKNWR